jgi:hypothetical protein
MLKSSIIFQFLIVFRFNQMPTESNLISRKKSNKIVLFPDFEMIFTEISNEQDFKSISLFVLHINASVFDFHISQKCT